MNYKHLFKRFLLTLIGGIVGGALGQILWILIFDANSAFEWSAPLRFGILLAITFTLIEALKQ